MISEPIDFLGDDRWTMFSMVLVGVFVSIPFTAYVFLAGLNAIPQDVYEAAGSTAPGRGRSTGGSRCRCCARRSWWRAS